MVAWKPAILEAGDVVPRGVLVFLESVGIFVVINLIFTGLALTVQNPESPQGSLRLSSQIPLHEAGLAALGAGAGCLACLAARRLGLLVIFTGIASIVLLDVDHLPVILGIPQPARPAHSLVFMAAVAVSLWLSLKRIDIPLMTVSAVSLHMTLDRSYLPLLSPITLQIVQPPNLQLTLAGVSIITAVLSGYMGRRTLARLSLKPAVDQPSTHTL